MIRVYTFRKVRLSAEDARACFEEIERVEKYYNRMIDELNRLVQAELDIIERLAKSPRFLAEMAVRYPWLDMSLAKQRLCDEPTTDEEKIKERQCAIIYPLIAHCAFEVRSLCKPNTSNCSRYGYHMAARAFDAAVSSTRKGTWPGERYRRRYPGGGGESVGVEFESIPWERLCAGRSKLFEPKMIEQRYGTFQLKVSDGHTLEGRVAWKSHGRNPRSIPPNATISRVWLELVGDYAQAYVDSTGRPRGKWYLRVEASIPDEIGHACPRLPPIGLDIGWSLDGEELLVAVTSEGHELRVPAYATRFHESVREIDSERAQLRNAVAEYLPLPEDRRPRSAAGLANYIQRNGLDVRMDIDQSKRELFSQYVCREERLHRTHAHDQRRPRNIREETYRKFIRSLGNRDVFFEYIAIKPLAENKLEKGDDGARIRTMAAPHTLISLLVNRKAIEVPALPDHRESLGMERIPSRQRAKILLACGIEGKRHQRTARKAVRKYRKRKVSSETAPDAPRMA